MKLQLAIDLLDQKEAEELAQEVKVKRKLSNV